KPRLSPLNTCALRPQILKGRTLIRAEVPASLPVQVALLPDPRKEGSQRIQGENKLVSLPHRFLNFLPRRRICIHRGPGVEHKGLKHSYVISTGVEVHLEQCDRRQTSDRLVLIASRHVPRLRQGLIGGVCTTDQSLAQPRH